MACNICYNYDCNGECTGGHINKSFKNKEPDKCDKPIKNKVPCKDEVTRQITIINNLGEGGTPVPVPTNHNDLDGLQGGNFLERYHLSNNQYDGLQGVSLSNNNKVVTQNDLDDIQFETNLSVSDLNEFTLTIGNDNGSGIIIPNVTNITAGLLSSFDKIKLDGIESNAQVNVQSDWLATSGDAFILNKPSTFTPSPHTHSISDINNLQNSLNNKEDLVNKVNTLTNPNDTTYPTTLAVANAISGLFSPVLSVNTMVGHVVLTKDDIPGLENVDNTSDLDKPVSNATQTALEERIPHTDKGVPNGVAELDDFGIIYSAQLPSYVDDVLEGTLIDLTTFEDLDGNVYTPETGKIYVDINDNKTYRWSGTQYTIIGNDLALGETATTAYRGDRGKIAYDHSQIISGNPHGTTLQQITSAGSITTDSITSPSFIGNLNGNATTSSMITVVNHTGNNAYTLVMSDGFGTSKTLATNVNIKYTPSTGLFDVNSINTANINSAEYKVNNLNVLGLATTGTTVLASPTGGGAIGIRFRPRGYTSSISEATIETNGNLNLGENAFLKTFGTERIGAGGGGSAIHTVVSAAPTGTILLRPKGYLSTDGQVTIQNSGTILAPESIAIGTSGGYRFGQNTALSASGTTTILSGLDTSTGTISIRPKGVANPSGEISINNAGVTQVTNLAGTGTRMVVASSTGVLSTQVVPTVGDLQTITTSGNTTTTDIEITDTTKGVILRSPDNNRWRITIGNDGILTTTQL